MVMFIDLGYVIPMWFAFHLWTSPTVRDPSDYDLMAHIPLLLASTPFGVMVGLGFPSLLMCLPSPALISFETREQWTVIYQGWPIWVCLANFTLMTIALHIDPRGSTIATEREKSASSWKYLRQTFVLVIALSAGTHLTCLAFLVPQIRAMFPAIIGSTASSLSRPPSLILEMISWRPSWDMMVGVASIAVLAWGLALRLLAREQDLSPSTVTTRVITTVGVAVFLGPSAAAANDIWARDGYVLLSGESRRGPKRTFSTKVMQGG